MPSDREKILPPGQLLPGDSADYLMPFVPLIDAGRCDGCDACINLCPHEAISLQVDSMDDISYRIDASDCTGCGICVDVCEQHAISLSSMAPYRQQSISLWNGKCRRCGADYHQPESGAGDSSLCRICRRVNHHDKLFQVIDG